MILHLNGLRAVAIIMVLLFHVFPSFSNGFLGVDIFLVISGYLLFRKFWEEEKVEVGSFIAKKVGRLFPLAVVVSLICGVTALFSFSYDLTLKTAKSALATLIGCSNIYYDYTFSDYFSSSVRLNPLIHTWYLSVIAQIYLIYVAISFVCRSKSKCFKVCLLLLLSAISFAVYYSPLWLPKLSLSIFPHYSTYYWTSGRLWMVCVGACAHLLPWAKGSRAMIAFSSLLLLVGMGSSNLGFGPSGIMALETMTVICTVVVIVFGSAPICAFILCRPLLQVIGRYSFSLYMIHWPVIVFCSYIASAYNMHEQISVQVAEIMLSLLLACVIYHGFEQRRYTLRRCACLLSIGVACCFVLIETNGMQDYLHPVANSVRTISYDKTGQSRPIESGSLYNTLPNFRQVTHRVGHGARQNWGESVPLLYEIGNQPEKANFILLGDSHAESLYPGLDVMAQKKGWNGAYLHTYVIPLMDVLAGGLPYQWWDQKKSETLFSYLADNSQVNTVLLANFWKIRFSNSYVNWDGERVVLCPQETKNYHCLREFLVRLRALGKKVVIFADVPEMPEHSVQGYVRRQLLYTQPVDGTLLLCTQESYENDNGEINDALRELEKEKLCVVLHPETVLFQKGKAHCFENGKLLYIDGHHLSVEGSIRCIQSLESSLGTLLKAADNH